MAAALQFAMSNATLGMEEEYNRWYASEHLPHVLRLPSVLAGQRFRRLSVESLPAGAHEYLVIWEFDDPHLALAQLAQAKGGDDLPIGPAIDMATLQPPTMWLRASVRSAEHPITDSSTRKTVLLVLVNPAPDAESECEADLVAGGLRRLADLPGVSSAHFLTLTSEQIRGNARKFRYGLFVELADEAAAVPHLAPALAALPHVDRNKWMASVFRPLGARVSAASARTSERVTGAHGR